MGWLLRRFFRLWVRAAVQPAEAPPPLTSPRSPSATCSSAIPGRTSPCSATRPSGSSLPYPEKRSGNLPIEERRTYFDVGRRRRFWDARISAVHRRTCWR